MEPELAEAVLAGRGERSGIGLANVDQRLRTLYGPEYGLVVETAPGAGTRITFRVPLSPVLPAIGFALCVWMMGSLSAVTWVVFGCWMAAGLVFYFLYGYRRSRLATSEVK